MKMDSPLLDAIQNNVISEEAAKLIIRLKRWNLWFRVTKEIRPLIQMGFPWHSFNIVGMFNLILWVCTLYDILANRLIVLGKIISPSQGTLCLINVVVSQPSGSDGSPFVSQPPIFLFLLMTAHVGSFRVPGVSRRKPVGYYVICHCYGSF